MARRGSRGRDAARRKAVTAQLLAGATPTRENAFKLPLVERTLGAVLSEARS